MKRYVISITKGLLNLLTNANGNNNPLFLMAKFAKKSNKI